MKRIFRMAWLAALTMSATPVPGSAVAATIVSDSFPGASAIAGVPATHWLGRVTDGRTLRDGAGAGPAFVVGPGDATIEFWRHAQSRGELPRGDLSRGDLSRGDGGDPLKIALGDPTESPGQEPGSSYVLTPRGITAADPDRQRPWMDIGHHASGDSGERLEMGDPPATPEVSLRVLLLGGLGLLLLIIAPQRLATMHHRRRYRIRRRRARHARRSRSGERPISASPRRDAQTASGFDRSVRPASPLGPRAVIDRHVLVADQM